MSTFKTIRGESIKSLTSDPSPVVTGDIWYNSTSQTLKGVVLVGAWASGGAMSQARYGLGGAGTQTAALAIAGSSTGSNSLTNVEKYDGSSWTAGNVLPVGRIYIGGCGTQTAALSAGGGALPGVYASINSYEYDGTNWTAGGNMAQITGTFGQLVGTQTAGLVIAGDQVPATPRSIANVEEYDGSSWTAVTAVPSVRNNTGNIGIQTAAIAAGGEAQTPPGIAYLTETLEYDGTNWTTGGALPINTYRAMACGTQTDGILFGGVAPPPTSSVTTTLNYDGAAWATNPASLATAKQQGGVSTSGTSSLAVTFGGSAPGVVADTQEYTKAAATKTFTTS